MPAEKRDRKKTVILARSVYKALSDDYNYCLYVGAAFSDKLFLTSKIKDDVI